MRLKILVTGGAGYIGSHTCKALAAAGYAPVVLDNLSAGHRWAVKWGPLVVGDIADRALVIKTLKRFNVQAVIHFAAHTYVSESVQQPRKYFDNNVSKTLSLLDALLDAGVNKLVFSSSCATYGIPRDLPIAEDHPQNPINPYGASKLFVTGTNRLTACATRICAISMLPGLIPTARSARTTHRRRTSFRSSLPQRRAGIRPSRYLAPITIRPMARQCGITSMSAISRPPTSKRSTVFLPGGRAPASIWAPVEATRFAMSSRPSRR
jgi:NAD(P)-dependent dehydrogenase (short-subunit alcohol dehydrogenase family)